ncbi:MAG: alginate export family protein [Pseudomonadales bacterium]
MTYLYSAAKPSSFAHMPRLIRLFGKCVWLPLLAGVLTLAGPLLADEARKGKEVEDPAANLNEAFTEGSVKLQFRYRYEQVDQDNALDDANASTLKSRITLQTKEYKNFKTLIEVDDVTAIGNDGYNSLRNGEAGRRSVVADPEGTEINQAWVAYSGIENIQLNYGRQRFNLDNQRFIGGVGWRQNEQTYDSSSISDTHLKDTTLTYAYIYNVNRIFGPDSAGPGQPDEDLDSDTHLVNINYQGLTIGTLSAYAYLMDFDNAAALSNKTFGIRLDGKQKLQENLSALYTAEYAVQEDYGDNTSYDAGYYLLEGGLKAKKVTVKLGYEVLEGDLDNSRAFITPLATLHKFQGWADQFLATPVGGIEDLYVMASATAFGVTFTAVYHDFEADEGGADYGEELGLAIAKNFGGALTGLLKYSSYDADDHNVDTDKLWLQLVVSF